eukprot:Skav235825  [mRNA]  locus=scaffold1931:61956:66332:- [translate_table: standard]
MTNPSLKQKIFSLAHTAEFWLPVNGPMHKEYKDVHVLVKVMREKSHDEVQKQWMKNYRVFTAKCCQPALPEVEYTPKISCHKILDAEITIIMDPNHASMVRSCRYGMENQLFTCFTDCKVQVFQGNLFLFANGKHSGLSVWADSSAPISRRCAELFCGGFGGWSFAMRTSQKLLDQPYTCQVAVDCDSCAVQMYSANHQAIVVGSQDDPRCFDSDADHTKAFVSHIQDAQWFHWVALSEIDVYLCSPPCPAWSLGSDMASFMRSDGQQTLQLAKVCRLTQPKVVLIENVNGFRSHPHFRLTVGVFKWAGYLLRDTFESDLGDVAPTSRKRWIGTFVRKDIEVYPAVHEWFKAYEHDLDNFGFALLDQPSQLLSECILDEELLNIYGDRRFMPTNWSITQNANSDVIDMCSNRCVKTNGKFGVFMAMYGRQHSLPEEKLQKKKLFAELMPAGQGQLRFITPIEQVLALMVDTCRIPKDLNVAYARIGNAIAPPQALYAMHMIETILGHECSFTPMDMVVDLVQSSLRPEHVRIEEDDKFWVILPKPSKEDKGSPATIASPPSKKTRVMEGDLHEHEETHDQATLVDETDPIEEVENDQGAPPGCSETAVWTVPAQPMVEPDIPENPVLEWFSVSFLMPFDTLTVRTPKGSDPSQLLIEHGFQTEYCQLKDLFTGARVEGCAITKDMVIDVHTDHETEPTMMKSLVANEMDFLRFVHEKQPWTNIVIAYRGHTIWSGVMPHDLELKTLHDSVSKAFYKIGIRCDLRWTHMARALNPFWGWRLNTISQAGTIKFHVHLPMIGGGGNSADDDLRNQIVALLASHAVPFTNLVTSVAQICYKHKPGVIRKVFQIQDPDERWKAMVELGKSAGVALRSDTKEAAASKIQKVVKKKGLTQQAEVDIGAIRLLPGSFKNDDGTDAKLSSQGFSANGSGVVLATLAEITPWIQASRHLSTDEFCAIVPGHHSCDTKLTMKRIQCQAIQADSSPLLFKATMIQFGEKDVSQTSIPGASVDCPKSMVIAMTVHWDEFQDQWDHFVQKPAKTILAMFSPEIQEKGVIAVWGQRFQLEGQKCAPSKSDSIQFHCRIREEFVSQTLKESGHNSVYTIPKDEQINKPDSKFSIVWTGSKKFDAELQAKEFADSMGIVRNRRMFGYRILHEDFQAAWAHSYPDKDMPKQIRVQMLFKIFNIPVSFTHQEVGKWLEGLTWNAKAIKRLGAGTWLIGAEVAPPQQTCLCNGQVVLVQKVEAKHANKSGQVLVGTPIAAREPTQSKEKVVGEQVPIDDAWAAFRANRGMVDNIADPSKKSLPREVEGPTATRLSAQDQKIEIMTKKLAEFETKTNDAIQQTNANVDKLIGVAKEQGEKIDQMDKRVDQKLKNHQQKTDQQLNSFHSAIQASNQANQDQFRVLREMLQASTAAASMNEGWARKAQKRTPKGSPRADGKEGEEDDEDEKDMQNGQQPSS